MTQPRERAAARSTGGILVLGLGNVLLGDDGIGPAVLALLERGYDVPLEVRLVDGGTLGLSLLDEICGVEHLILVDAVATDAPPGTLVRLDGAEVMDAVRERLSVHQVGVADLLDAARLIGCYPAKVVLHGIVPGNIGMAVARTPAVESAMAALVSAIIGDVHSLGYDLVPRRHASAGDRPIHALTRHFGM